MLASMTAFGRAEGKQFTWELRSVNHRFLELSFRLPDNLRELELPLREQARNVCKRGKIDATLRLTRHDAIEDFHINRPTLLQLLATLEQIRRDAPEIGHPDPLDLLRWPGVLDDAATGDDDALKAEICARFDAGLAALFEHRGREGERIDAILRTKLIEVESHVAALERVSATLTAELRDRLRARLDDLVRNLDASRLDAGRLEQEVAMLAQRADVVEELDRLRIHVEECRKCLDGDGPHGRRLDFLMQELNREANTLASKSVLPETSQRAVDLKVVIEQMREQIQNVE